MKSTRKIIGTAEFAQYKQGDKIEILGPLGNGFPMERAEGKKVFLIGGGIGIPPMVELSKQLSGEKTVIAGYRDDRLFLKEELAQNAAFYAATEDGSAGTKGNVLDAIRENKLTAYSAPNNFLARSIANCSTTSTYSQPP